MRTKIVTVFGMLWFMSGCASNNELFARYDRSCDLPKTKVVEKVKVVDKVVYKSRGDAGMNWEPAVYFGFDRDGLVPSEQRRLDKNVVILKKYPSIMINIQSFTDNKGSSQYNSELARKRQETVRAYLQKKGIANNRIVLSPLGEDLPILGNDIKGRQINRRVELMMLDESGRPMALKIRPQPAQFHPPGPVM